MPDDPSPTSPDTPPLYNPARRVGSGLAGETTRNDGSIILPDANPHPLDVIGDFEVMSKLGQGGMGAVYRARQVSLDRQVALKILPSNFEADADYVSRFQREARVASSLHHANLVKVYASGQADGCHFIAMELIEGETLGQWVKRGALPPLEALRITLAVARALECGWRTAQLIHRDIKPGNIFLSVEGEVKLGDLGLAKIVGTDSTGLTHTGAAMGTPHYISPEQARGDKDLDFRADIYSLGCTLYQMLTKQTPYSGHDPVVVLNQHINAAPPAILKVMPQCPLPLARLVGKMLKKQRRERHTSYEELIAAIESVRAQLDPSLTAPTIPARVTPEPVTPAVLLPPPPTAPAKSKLLLYAGIGVVVLAGAAFFLWPKEEKLTQAQRYARDHAGEQRDQVTEAGETHAVASPGAGLAQARPSDIPTQTSAAAYPQPRVWIDDTENIRSGLKDGSLVADGEWLVATKNVYATLGGGRTFRDSAVRVVFSNFVDVQMRRPIKEQPGKGYWAFVWPRPVINLFDPATNNFTNLNSKIELGTDYVPEAIHELVFTAQGDQFSLWLDGKEAAAVKDSTQTEGKMGLVLFKDTRPAPRIKKVEYGELEAAGTGQAPTTPTAASLSPSAEPWQDVLRDPAKLDLYHGGVERTLEGLRFTDYGSAVIHQGPKRDGAVRMLATFGGARVELVARETNTAGLYQLSAKDRNVILLRRNDAVSRQITDLREFPLIKPLQSGLAYQLELRVVGQTLTAKCNGEILGTVTDGNLAQGGFGVALGVHDSAPTLVKALEVLDLDSPGGASAAPADPRTTAAFPPGQWVKPIPDLSKLSNLAEFKDGWARLNDSAQDYHITLPQSRGVVLFRNAGLRVRRQVRPQWSGGVPILAVRNARGNMPRFFELFYFGPKSAGSPGSLAIYENRRDLLPPDPTKDQGWAAQKKIALKEIPPISTEFTAELIAIGNTLIGRINDQSITCTVDDGDGTGQLTVFRANTIPFRDLEVINLDGLPEAEALKLVGMSATKVSPSPALPSFPSATPVAATYPQPRAWIDTTAGVRSAGLKDGSLAVDGEWLEATKTCRPSVTGSKFGNVAVRVLFANRTGVQLRHSADASYNAGVSSKSAAITFYQKTGKTVLAASAVESTEAPDTVHELVFAAQGDALTMWLDGSEVAVGKDTTLTAGTAELALMVDGKTKPPRIKKVEYGELETVGTGQAATKDAPFVNGLGMKFVPVPIVGPARNASRSDAGGGLTTGKTVLFSVWDTRVQDYEVFVQETKREWLKASFEQGPTHPAVNVSWDDAQAFCAWLTGRERKAGKLGANEVYRLPTDHEWSCAVGIGDREDAAKLPVEKSQKITDAFPWGTQWPPPAGAGNYAGEELRPALAAGEYSYLKDVISGYNDGFVNTSPVGSFTANRFGLFDLGGNVMQWCEDWYDKDQQGRVLRGAIWNRGARSYLLSSLRDRVVPSHRSTGIGFRCVVVASVP